MSEGQWGRGIRNALGGAAILGAGIACGHALARAYVELARAATPEPAWLRGPRALETPTPLQALPSPQPAVADAGVPALARGSRGRRELALPERGLHGAAARGELHRIRTELDQGAPIDQPDSAGHTPLAITVLAGEPEAFELLVASGASLLARTSDDRTLLMLAARRGSLPILRRLLQLEARLEARDRAGDTALLVAARHADADAAQLLLEAGARIDVQGADGMSALLHAASRSPDALLELLVARGANLELRDRHGATALCIGAEHLRPATARTLLAAGARVDAANHVGLTPLGYALSRRSALSPSQRRRREELAEALAAAGANFSLLHAPSLRGGLDLAAFDALALRHGQAALPSPVAEAPPALASHVTGVTDGAATRLFELRRRTGSRRLPARLDNDMLAHMFGRDRVANVVHALEVRDLVPGPGQRLVLAGDPAGQWGFSVDDALLFEVGGASGPRRRVHVGALEGLSVDGAPVDRLGPRGYQLGPDAIDLRGLFAGGPRVVIKLIDWGGQTMNSDIFLRVLGPGAGKTLSRARVTVLP